MSGTMVEINRSLLRPVLVAGVEKQLMVLNALICFPFIAVTHLQLPACLFGVGLFMMLHIVLRQVSKSDPHLGQLLKRARRFFMQSYYPAISHPRYVAQLIKTV